MVQRSPALRILRIEDVDLGSGALEWLCKGLRSHKVGSPDTYCPECVPMASIPGGDRCLAADWGSFGARWFQDDAERPGPKHIAHRSAARSLTVVWETLPLSMHLVLVPGPDGVMFAIGGRKDRCGLLDSGLAELSAGLKDHAGQLEFLTLRNNMWLAQAEGDNTRASADCHGDVHWAHWHLSV